MLSSQGEALCFVMSADRGRKRSARVHPSPWCVRLKAQLRFQTLRWSDEIYCRSLKS